MDSHLVVPEAGPTYLRSVMVFWGLLVAVLLVVLVTALAEPFQPDGFGPGQDARAYWSAPLDHPYEPGSVGHESAYLYSPAFLVALSPLRALPFPIFLGLWTVILLAVLYWLSGPLLFLPLVVLCLPELWGGNITILLAAAVVVGLSRPAAWAFPLLTKVTPGLGLLWHGVRREWSALLVAAVATLGIIVVTAVVTPNLWADWFALLRSSTGSSTVPGSVPVPLILRLPVAVAVIVYAARTGRAWLLPVGILLAMPVVWWGSLALLTATVALKRDVIEAYVERLLGRLEGLHQARVAAREVAAPSG
jgi:hypothetical protein